MWELLSIIDELKTEIQDSWRNKGEEDLTLRILEAKI